MQEIGKLMNETFVSIKVDREERPDLDSVYLAVTRTLTGDAGWPNNVMLTAGRQAVLRRVVHPEGDVPRADPAMSARAGASSASRSPVPRR